MNQFRNEKITYLNFKGSPYGAAPLITPFCIPDFKKKLNWTQFL